MMKKIIIYNPLKNHPPLYKRHKKIFRKITKDMTFKRELIEARDLKNYGNFKQALAIFERLYEENPEGFTYKQKVDYAWTIIKVRMQDMDNIGQLREAADLITGMLPQANLNVSRSCPYTSSVFKVLIGLYNDNRNLIAMIPWLEKLNPELLDERPYRSHGRPQKSRRESFYNWASMAYYENMDFERCIDVCKKGLDTLTRFQDSLDTWLHWRMARSLKELNRISEALLHFLEVVRVKDDWYMYREIAECYCMLKKPLETFDYLCLAVLSDESFSTKMNLYLLCYRIFKAFNNHEMALKHAQLYYLMRLEKGYYIPQDIYRLGIDETQLDKKQLEMEIIELWAKYKYRNHERCQGTVVNFIEEKNFGFIKTDGGRDIFFHGKEFLGDTVLVGQPVSFYVEDNFDKSKNRKSQKAVIVRGE